MDKPAIVSTKQGLLQGKHESCNNGFKFLSFCGIPYAQPPIGELRFKPPRPFGKWNGVRQAVTEGDMCYAYDALLKTCDGSEDCLYLNVYCPEETNLSEKSKTVMVYIHGGGFAFGSGSRDVCGPEFLVQKDIVLVTLNYRVGTLGFLYLEDQSLGVYGNAGLKDQVMALQWVQENIHAFGGDPGNVTIFGESAGGASVHFQILSPLSKGLFHKAILQSGTAIAPWCLGNKDYCSVLMEKLGRTTKNDAEILQVLQSLSKEELLAVQNTMPMFTGHSQFGPVVEGYHDFQPFLPEEPANVLQSGNYNKVPMIIGFNSAEGTFMKMLKTKGEETPYGNLDSVATWNYRLPSGHPKCFEISRRVKEFYYGKEEPNTNSSNYCKIVSDLFFVCTALQTIKIMVKQWPKHPIYGYKFNLRTNLNHYSHVTGLRKEDGVCHVDDLMYMFNTKFTPKIELGSIEEKSINKITTWWTNFAKYGNPNGEAEGADIEWPTVGHDFKYLNIDDEITIVKKPYEDSFQFWSDINKYVKSV